MLLTSVRFIAAVAVVLSVALFTTAVEGQRFFPSARTLEEPCEGGGYNPTPVAVAVTSVPIVVTSTTDDYFVLYVKHDVDGTEVEMPVLVKLGQASTTTLAENVEALPAERYRVEKYLITDPADVDGDCIDDITELADPVGMNPVNPAAVNVALIDGTVAVPDRQTYADMLSRASYGSIGDQVHPDRHGHRPAGYLLHKHQHACVPSILPGCRGSGTESDNESGNDWLVPPSPGSHCP